VINTKKQIAGLLTQLHGIDVSKYEDSFLNKSLQKRITESHCNSAEEYCTLLEQSNTEGKTFIESLHINYSQFFRNPLIFAVLERIILPSMVMQKKKARRKEIRIWSAACAEGQEAYSLAMLLEELKDGQDEKIKYRIFATDRCDAQINRAAKGQYPATALDNINLKRAGQWFSKQGDIYTLKPQLRANIDFSVFDLFDEQLSSPPVSIFGDFDLVICANLLFYYKPEFREIIVKKTTNSLANNAYLITGEVEREILMNHNYHEVFPQSAIFQK